MGNRIPLIRKKTGARTRAGRRIEVGAGCSAAGCLNSWAVHIPGMGVFYKCHVHAWSNPATGPDRDQGLDCVRWPASGVPGAVAE